MYTYSGCCGLGQSSALLKGYAGLGEVEEELAWLSASDLDCQGEAQILAQGVAYLVQQLGGVTTTSVFRYEGDELWSMDVTCTPFLVTSPTTITSPWVSDSDVIGGEEMLDAIGEGFVDLVRYVDDLNRSSGVASSNHRIDMGSVEIERKGGQSRFSVTVYPPVGTVSPEEEEVISEEIVGPVEDGKKKVPTWFIVGGIAAGVLAVGGTIGAIVWARKKR